MENISYENVVRSRSAGVINIHNSDFTQHADTLDENGIIIDGEWRSQEISNVLPIVVSYWWNTSAYPFEVPPKGHNAPPR